MKTKLIAFIVFIATSLAVNAQRDLNKMPKPGPDPEIKLGETIKFSLKNGLKVIMVENHKLPRVSANLTIDNTPYVEGDKAGVSSIMGSLLGRGTANISKDDFNEKVDYLGANINFYSSGASARSLTKYFTEVLGLLADGVKNSEFTQEEFDKEKKVTLEGLKSQEKDVTTTARRVESALTYGKNHPDGEFVTKETVNNITLTDVKENFNTYYKPNNAYLVIIGDINPKKTKKLIKSLFKDWKSGDIPTTNYTKPTNVENTEINFVNMPNAVQSEVTVMNTTNLTLGDSDYYATLLANKILGGGGSARLFNNLREDKGYTYGSYSSISQSRRTGSFRAFASVRNIVTDSAIVEIKKEIDNIKNNKVSAKELNDAKEEYIGGFVMDVQKPATAARYALNIARYNLPENFYANYIKNINAVTVEDVQKAAKKHFKSDKARIIVTGKAIDVMPNLEKVGYTIKYFDKEANATEKPEMVFPIPDGMNAKKVVDNYIKAIGGKDKVMAIKSVLMVSKGKVQGIEVTAEDKMMAPNKMSKTISGMGQVFQKTVFNGTKGYNEVQGRKMDMTTEQVDEIKATTIPFTDMSYTSGKLDRIEPIDGKNCYVIQHNSSEIFYDVATGLKTKEIRTVKGPQGEVKVPTTYGNYKAVNGVLFPHAVNAKMGPMDLNFEVEIIKINEGVSDKDFE
ncbi:insulinase family protein [Polaribacter sp. WD7]|uniref:M16 family metallopeptidase n=1 Tax=Polaribacter sp. WD7 TaxID=2269061 RepID=UPI000DF258EF|nr:pitrilysin family protein [Polaribacter sp. WD7]RCS27764.1 insulinase family protein [Polaribacter sp. WD7]